MDVVVGIVTAGWSLLLMRWIARKDRARRDAELRADMWRGRALAAADEIRRRDREGLR